MPNEFKKLLVSFLPVNNGKYEEIIAWLASRNGQFQLDTLSKQLSIISTLLTLLMKPAFAFDEVVAFIEDAILGEDKSRKNDKHFKEVFAQCVYVVMNDKQNTFSILPLYCGDDKTLIKLIKDRYGVRSIDTSTLDLHTQTDIKLTIEDEINKKVKKAMEL